MSEPTPMVATDHLIDIVSAAVAEMVSPSVADTTAERSGKALEDLRGMAKSIGGMARDIQRGSECEFARDQANDIERNVDDTDGAADDIESEVEALREALREARSRADEAEDALRRIHREMFGQRTARERIYANGNPGEILAVLAIDAVPDGLEVARRRMESDPDVTVELFRAFEADDDGPAVPPEEWRQALLRLAEVSPATLMGKLRRGDLPGEALEDNRLWRLAFDGMVQTNPSAARQMLQAGAHASRMGYTPEDATAVFRSLVRRHPNLAAHMLLDGYRHRQWTVAEWSGLLPFVLDLVEAEGCGRFILENPPPHGASVPPEIGARILAAELPLTQRARLLPLLAQPGPATQDAHTHATPGPVARNR
jgi:hypothetical protein